jgi:hypothetical protein
MAGITVFVQVKPSFLCVIPTAAKRSGGTCFFQPLIPRPLFFY